MIYDIDRHELLMDFSNIPTPAGQPSDLDMFYIGDTRTGSNYVIFGEIKNEEGNFTQEQRRLYENLSYHMTYTDVLILYITHDKKVENGYKRVDISKCYVSEYWFKPCWNEESKGKKIEWQKPKMPITVEQLFIKFIGRYDKQFATRKEE